VENNHTVNFYGSTNSILFNDEVFYNLSINKDNDENTMTTSGINDLNVLNNLTITHGVFEPEANMNVLVLNDVLLEDGGGWYANNSLVSIGGDWNNLNSTTGINTGFHAETSIVTFNGMEHQYLLSDVAVEEFNQLIISKNGGSGNDSFEPQANIRVLGDLNISAGNWFDTPSDNLHEFYGDIDIAVEGRWTDAAGIVELLGPVPQSFVNDGGGYFDIIMFNKSNATDQVNLGGNLIFDYLNINSGDVTMAESYYLNHEGVFVEADASLTLDAGTWLVSDAGAGITVSAGGQMAVNGTNANHCVITENGGSGFYNFDVYGELGADYTEFRRMSADGININSGSTLTSAHAFNNCSFSSGEAGGTYLTINNSQTITSDGVAFNLNNWGGNSNVRKTLNQGNITFTNFIGDFAGESFDDDPYNRIDWDEEIKEIDVSVFLEGPYSGGIMETTLNSQDLIPNDQPYDVSPWNYSGSESVPNMPNTDVVDWILLEYRDAPNASSATESTIIGRQAAFLLNNGNIVDIDGSSLLNFPYTLNYQLFVVIWHRNHLGIMSAAALTESGGIFVYDFSSTSDQAHGTNAMKNLGGIYGMYSGDANADDIINHIDRTVYWNTSTGQTGYLPSDFSMDGQVNNADKNDYWHPNIDFGSQVPE